MSDLDIVVQNILDEDDDVESKKEQDAIDRAESCAKNPTNKIPKPFLGEAIALLRETIKLHTTQSTGMGSKSKVDSILRLTAGSASYRTNSVNLVADPPSYCTTSVKLVADPDKSCCLSNNVPNTLTADSAVPRNTNSGSKCASENSDEDYLNDISMEYEKIERKGPPLNDKLTKNFQDLIWNNTKSEEIENLLNSVLLTENFEGLEPSKVGKQSHIKLSQLI